MAHRRASADDGDARPFAVLSTYALPAFLSGVLALPTISNYLFGGNPYLVASSVFTFLPALAWLVLATPPTAGHLRRTLLLLLVAAVPLVVSVFVHLPNYDVVELQQTLVRIFALVVYMALAALLVCQSDDRLIARTFGLMGLWMLGLFAVSSALDPLFVWGRFMPGNMQPNWWGEVLLAATFGAAFVPTRLLRYGLMAVAFAGLVLVQSRSGMVGAFFVAAFAVLHHEGLRRLAIVGGIAVFALPSLYVLLDVGMGLGIKQALIGFVASDVLLLDDPRRGLDSGATGRAEGWLVALRMFAEAPFLGAGLGVSSERVADVTGEALHNGHLILLNDLGVILYGIVSTVIVGALVRLVTGGDLRLLGLLLGYLIVLLVQPRSINVSVVPMLAWIVIAMAWLTPRRREPASSAAPPRPRLPGRRWQREPVRAPAAGRRAAQR
ncbi:MAG: hypothetical protein GVY35_09175 [Bacteroidetes bacterium]|jgi:hypothetical protein|nr:hypothetical protein [Bacteroidota bacterium]